MKKKKTQDVTNEELNTPEIPDVNSQPIAKPIKNISKGQCVKTIIFSLIALCVVFVPITFGNFGINLTYTALPIVGNGLLTEIQTSCALGFCDLIGGADVVQTIASLLNIATISYFSILALNILFSSFLLIFRIQACRIIFKIYSILAGFVMIFILAMNILHIVGLVGLIIKGRIALEMIMTALETSAILTVVATAIMSGLLIKRQFKWFEKLY